MQKLKTRIKLLQGARETWPPDSEEILLQVLRDDRAPDDDRERAAEIVHDFVIINDDILETLIALARRDDDSQLRTQAILALGPAMRECLELGFDGPELPQISPRSYLMAQLTLRELFFDPDLDDSLKWDVLQTATYAPDTWVHDAVRAAFHHEDFYWRETAVVCMRRVPGFEKEIIEALTSGGEGLPYEALRAVEAWSVDAAWPYLEKMLTTPEPDRLLLEAAMRTAAKLRPAEAVRLLDPFTRGKNLEFFQIAETWKEEAEQALCRPARPEAWRKKQAAALPSHETDDSENGGGLLH